MTLPQTEMLIDIGAKTIRRYEGHSLKSRDNLCQRADGRVRERDGFRANGTKAAVWEAIAASHGFSVVGVGGTVLPRRTCLVSATMWITSVRGGGALVRFLSGEELPVVKALKGAGAKVFG